MLVSTDATTIADRDQRGCPLMSGQRGRLPEKCSEAQSNAVQMAGRRKPRNAISSKKGASVTPNPNSSQAAPGIRKIRSMRSEEHTSELQSLRHLVCRL